MKRELISTSRLAEICGVSQGTVDRALHGREGISPKTKERILRVAREYGYRPNPHARSMKGGRSMLIGVVVFDLDNQFFSELVSSVEAVATELGYYTIVMLTHRDPQRELRSIENLYHMSVDGIILCPINRGEDFGNLLRSLSLPVVTVGNRLSDIPYAGIDNRAAMAEATRYILQKGYRRLIYVMPKLSPDQNTYAQSERLQGFRKVAQEAGISSLTVSMDEALSLPSPEEKTALICPSDLYAMRLYHRVERDGFGLLGFDDLRLLEDIRMNLCTVSQSIAVTAERAVHALLSSEKDIPTVPHRLILRQSL
jgi:LacI family transcriptional regulator